MKTRTFALILCVLLIFAFSSCGEQAPQKPVLLNYTDNPSLLAVGNTFVTVSENNNEICIFPTDGSAMPYVYAENAVFICEHEHHGGYSLVGADDVSFYYLRRSYSGDGYGEGHGARIYRYYVDTGKSELVYRDVALTNFDGFLGLEDILGFSGPVSNSAVTEMGGFWIDGKYILTAADLLQTVKEENEAQSAGIRLGDHGFDYCVSDKSVFFTDAFRNLYLYRLDAGTFTELAFNAVSMFFVTEKNLFVIPSEGADLTVCDLYGSVIKTIPMESAVFNNAHCSRTENGALYLQDQIGIIWRIDESLTSSMVCYIPLETRWTVKNGIVYYYNAEQNAVLPALE